MIEAGIFNLLSTTAAITAMCEKRIYPLVLPPGQNYPALTYQIISAIPDATFSTSGFQRWRIQFDAWGNSYGDAANLRAALVKTLNGYQGTLSDGTYLQNADFIQATDYFAQDSRVYRCMAEFRLFFNFNN